MSKVNRHSRHYLEWTNEEDLIMQELYPTNSTEVLVNKLGRSWTAIVARAETLFLEKQKNVYALYKGDDLLAVGTQREITKQIGISDGTFCSYNSKRARDNHGGKRRYVIKIEDD